jgi:hypothetical protein
METYFVFELGPKNFEFEKNAKIGITSLEILKIGLKNAPKKLVNLFYSVKFGTRGFFKKVGFG